MAAFLAIIIYLPAQGRVSVPMHDAVAAFLGRAAFVLPLACAFVGTLLLVRTLRPAVVLPKRRLAGVGILLVAVLASEHLLDGDRDGSGLVGAWLSSLFLDLLGAPVTFFLLLLALTTGVLLAFNLRVRLPRATRPQQGAES